MARPFAQAEQECGFGTDGPTLYSIRHGGASEDVLCGCHDIDGVFRSWRWRAWSSLCRYGKKAQLQAELSKAPVVILEYGRARASNITATFQHPRLVPGDQRQHRAQA